MKKYISFFRLRLVTGLQYRAAALAGIVTQFLWGIMEIAVLRAFYESDPSAYPMTMEETCAYIWLRETFLTLLGVRMFEGEILDAVKSGNIAYELCRPVHIYDMWFARSMAHRVSGAGLRSIPILLVSFILPKPFRMSGPADLLHFAMFLVTLILALLVATAFSMLVYVSGFYLISSDGARMLAVPVVEFLAGDFIPLPFFPEGVQKVLDLLPFASMQNVPLRVYSGNLSGDALYRAVFLQVFWFAALTVCGKLLCNSAEKRVTLQGG